MWPLSPVSYSCTAVRPEPSGPVSLSQLSAPGREGRRGEGGRGDLLGFEEWYLFGNLGWVSS